MILPARNSVKSELCHDGITVGARRAPVDGATRPWLARARGGRIGLGRCGGLATVLQRIHDSLADIFTGVQLVLMIGAGLLSRYSDAPMFNHKGQGLDARFAQTAGLVLLIAAALAIVIRLVGRFVLG